MIKLDRATWGEVSALLTIPVIVAVAATSQSHFLRGMLYVLSFAVLLTVEFTEKRLRAQESPALQDERKTLIELRANNVAYQLLRVAVLIGALTDATDDRIGVFFGLFVLSLVAPLAARFWYDYRL